MNNQVFYGQTFSKGQLTIPKKIRDFYSLGDNFSYKITHQDRKIIVEPQQQTNLAMTNDSFVKFVSSMDTSWYDDSDYKDYLKSKKQLKNRKVW
jgi:bifunctional DNA-binding transcriptional regulator/antitoxin component of YhaV-PrlF toxin-antitoxin module